ncbi:hypothetical protein BH11ARM1_BH11ARM1_06400 [soil metagenome]
MFALALLAQGLSLTPALVDLGRLDTNKIAFAEFNLLNSTARVLHIKKVDSSCGCSIPSFPQTIQAGSTGRIRVQFTPQLLWDGNRQERVFVTTDDSSTPRLVGAFTVNLIPTFRFSPALDAVIKFAPGLSATQNVGVTGRDTTKRLISVKSASNRISATKTNAGFTFATVKSNEPGDFEAEVSLTTSDPATKLIHYTIRAQAQSGPYAKPCVVKKPMVSLKSPALVATFLVMARDRAVKAISANSSDEALSVKITPDITGKGSRVTIEYVGGWKPGPHAATISIDTDDKRFRQLKVPVIVQASY